MSEHLNAEIWIGGQVPRRTARRLCAAIRDQAVSLEWGEAWFDPAQPSDLMDACRDVQGTGLLYLCDEEAPWGRLETLESFLIRNQIPFRRRSEGKYEYDPELAEFRPGHELLVLYTNHRGEALVSLAVIRQIQDDLRATAAALRRSEPAVAKKKLRQALKLLASRLPPELPPLPSFEVV